MARLYTQALLTCALLSHLTMRAVEADNSEEKIALADLDKRYLAALAKNGRLSKDHSDRDRLQERTTPPDSEATWLKKPSDSVEKDSLDPNDKEKRYLGDFLRSRGRPVELKEKRNIAALARMGWLNAARTYRSFPALHSMDGVKREDLLYGDGPSVLNQEENCVDEQDKSSGESKDKRNIAAMARNGRLPSLRNNWDYWSLKRNPFIRYSQGSWPSAPVVLTQDQFSGQRYPSLNRNKSKRCSSTVPEGGSEDMEEEERKRNIAAMARKGFLPQRRNMDALARKGINPRGGVASMARKGLLPSSYPANRRNLSRLARQGMIPNQKKNAASMARKGMLPM